MQKSVFLVTYINESSIQSGHNLFDFPVIDIPHRKLYASLLRRQLYQPLVF